MSLVSRTQPSTVAVHGAERHPALSTSDFMDMLRHLISCHIIIIIKVQTYESDIAKPYHN